MLDRKIYVLESVVIGFRFMKDNRKNGYVYDS